MPGDDMKTLMIKALELALEPHSEVQPCYCVRTQFHMSKATYALLYAEVQPMVGGLPIEPPDLDKEVVTLFGMRVQRDESLPVGQMVTRQL